MFEMYIVLISSIYIYMYSILLFKNLFLKMEGLDEKIQCCIVL